MTDHQGLEITAEEAEHICVLRSLADTDRKAIVESAKDLCVFGERRSYAAIAQDGSCGANSAASVPS